MLAALLIVLREVLEAGVVVVRLILAAYRLPFGGVTGPSHAAEFHSHRTLTR